MVLLLGTSPASWGGFKEGQAAYIRQDYTQALREWSAAAEKGDPQAQFQLAVLYEQGQGTGKGLSEALKWTRMAAENGDANAQFSLGTLLERGTEFPKDEVEGAKWIERGIAAANSGDPQAQFRLSLLYRAGRHVERNELVAQRWLDSSAALGNASAQAELGERYLHGRGVEKNPSEARNWLEKAATQGEDHAIALLLPLLAQDFNSARDEASAAQVLRRSAELDDSKSQYLLAQSYWNGRGVSRDPVQACTWMLIAGAKPQQLAQVLDGFTGRVNSTQLANASRDAAEWRQLHPKAPIDPRSYE
jgi:uncharacterized protein